MSKKTQPAAHKDRKVQVREFLCANVIIRNLHQVSWEKVFRRVWGNGILTQKQAHFDQYLNVRIEHQKEATE